MPRVQIDYVVSFSSEDPEHPASNLLQREVSKKKWLCKKGESSCSVVLQLPRTVKITGVHIGAYHAALVEVLVGRAETSSEQFQVLVPSSVFISREESRRDAPVVRVRSFGADALSAQAREQRWDRVRLVCAQPHNKHCQFGLSFVHVDEAEPAAPSRLLTLDTFSSDEDDFKPGELFAKHLQNTSGELQTNSSSNTGQQIRQATSQALKNIPESSTKLLKTPISKPAASRAHSPPSARCDRARAALLYTSRDTEPHARIDRVLSRHERDKEHDQSSQTTKHDNTDKQNNTNQRTKDDSNTREESKIKNETKTKDEPKRTSRGNKSESLPRPQRHNKPTSDQNKEVRKRRRSSQELPIQGLAPGPVSAAPHTLLRGCVLVLSGYAHPRRAAVRDLALALGARVQRDWGPGATHLICAFPNTPKLRAVRAAAGDSVPVARAAWLEQLCARRRLLPWRWYATEQRLRVQPAPELLRDEPQPAPELLRDEPQPAPELLRDEPQPASELLRNEPQPDTRHTQHDPDSDGDTDDEIEKVLQAQKKRRLTDSKTNIGAHKYDDSTVATTSDVTRAATRDTDDELATDEEGAGPGPSGPSAPGRGPSGPSAPGPAGLALPDFFAGLTFALDAAPDERRRMSRYVRAYGGLVLEMSEVAEGSEVDYIVRGRSTDTRPSDTQPSDTRPSDTHPSDTRPSDTRPSDTRPSDTRPSDTRPSDTRPSDTRPSDTRPSDTRPSDTRPSDTRPSDTRPSDTRPSDTRPSDTRLVSAAWLARCHDAKARLPHEHTLTKIS